MNQKRREALKEAFQTLTATSFLIIYGLFAVSLVLAFFAEVNFVIKTDKNGYNDALNLLIGLLVSIIVTTYSITVVALQLASTQFSPRILRYFLSKSVYTQATLGLFLGFVMYGLFLKFWLLYALPAEPASIPSLYIFALNIAIYGGILLIAGLLPHFIITIAQNINAASIIRKISLHLINEINYSKQFWQFQEKAKKPVEVAHEHFVISQNFGYLEEIHYIKLKKLLETHSNIVFLEQLFDVGSFILKDVPIARWASQTPITDLERSNMNKIIYNSFKISKFRSYKQDVNFGVRQLVDIALKAISPAVNDPTTAINCLDYLGEILKQLMQANMPVSGFMKWKSLPLYLNEASFNRIVNQAFDQIYHYGRADFAVFCRIIDTVTRILPFAHQQAYTEVLAEEILEIGNDYIFQLKNGNLAQAHSFEQLQRITKLLRKAIKSIEEHSQNIHKISLESSDAMKQLHNELEKLH